MKIEELRDELMSSAEAMNPQELLILSTNLLYMAGFCEGLRLKKMEHTP